MRLPRNITCEKRKKTRKQTVAASSRESGVLLSIVTTGLLIDIYLKLASIFWRLLFKTDSGAGMKHFSCVRAVETAMSYCSSCMDIACKLEL